MTVNRLFALLPAVLLCIPGTLKAQTAQAIENAPTAVAAPVPGLWTAPNVEHIAGLPDIKSHKKGTLSLTSDELTFTAKDGRTAIPRGWITAASSGNQRVEMWGMTGRILRMAIPDNGGLAVAAVAHHRIDMLTIDYTDARGGNHSAVFFMGANLAAAALQNFALQAKTPHASMALDCQNAATEPRSIFVAEPDWRGAQVPAVYQGLLYEHLIERFRKSKSLNAVYREGEKMPEGLCPRYTVHLSISGFKEGSSVKRAMYGPVGMFVGTTQMVFDAELSDRTDKVKIKEQIKTTVRGEGESTSVADHVAKTLVKKYEKALKKVDTESAMASQIPKA
ncbi:hypothetical protein [Terriglobus roseus]|uniref:DUF4412 domain-containing protein n=1 Tax=Terriglobus roseus TaxID=392734 RepID=A0A1H4Q5W4_9BACT|nr:hypothetical protein [Terriglobus roseus]SEC15003.1 hypothetical protein SAMN05443244_2775 [Terriglobus roseus]